MAMNKLPFYNYPGFFPQIPQIPPISPQFLNYQNSLNFMPNFSNFNDKTMKELIEKNISMKEFSKNNEEIAVNCEQFEIKPKFENSLEFEQFRNREKLSKTIDKSQEKCDKSIKKHDKSNKLNEQSCEKCRKIEKPSQKLDKCLNIAEIPLNQPNIPNFFEKNINKQSNSFEKCPNSSNSFEKSLNIANSFENDSKHSNIANSVENCEKSCEKPLIYEKNEGIYDILKYFIQNIGRVRSNRLNFEREKYVNNNDLLLGNKLKTLNSITKSAKSKKEFDKIFNDFYMNERKTPEKTDEKKEDFSKEKLIFT